MKFPARLKSVIDITASYDCDQTSQPLDRFLREYFRTRRYMGSKDRHFIKEQTYAYFRHKAQIEWWAEQQVLYPKADNLVAIFFILKKEFPFDEIIEAYGIDKYAPEKLTDSTIEKLNPFKKEDFLSPKQPDATQANCPKWIYKSLKDSFGEYKEELSILNEKAPFDIRVNTLKSSVEEFKKWLEDRAYDFEQSKISDLGFRLSKDEPIGEWDIFKKGWVEVQDFGSQILSLAADVKPGERIVDFCAGAGGKTLALAAMMKNKGQIYACDVSEKRLQRTKKRLKRAGIDNVRLQTLTSERDKWVKKHQKQFDCVLLDVPCSGTGTWRRNPESRWRFQPSQLDELQQIQQNILESACRLVKEGGRLIYSTCSYLKQENEDQIEKFLTDHPEFTYTESDQRVIIPDTYSKLGQRLFVTQNDTDGYYYCILRRSKNDK